MVYVVLHIIFGYYILINTEPTSGKVYTFVTRSYYKREIPATPDRWRRIVPMHLYSE